MAKSEKTRETAGRYLTGAISGARERALRRFGHILERVDPGTLENLAELDDAGFLASLEQHVLAHAAAETAQGRARARGDRARAELFRSADVLTVEQAAEQLGILPESVRKKIQRNRLLPVTFGGDIYIPEFQITDGRVSRIIPDLLKALEPMSEFTKLDWFLKPHPDFDGQKPADLLTTHGEQLLEAASRYATQGGA